MTIDEAIKILVEANNRQLPAILQELDNAMKLGIEALKREKQRRYLELTGIKVLLPGETEE